MPPPLQASAGAGGGYPRTTAAPQAGAAAATQAGGAALIAAQANCPFAAVARFRMGARPLEEPSYSVDGALGGTLVHELLQRVWQAFGDCDALARHDEAALQSLLAPLASATLDDLGRRRPDIFTTRFKQIEAGDITVVDLEPKSSQHVHVGFVVIQNNRLDTRRHEHSPQVGAQTPESRQDDRAFLDFDNIGISFSRNFL